MLNQALPDMASTETAKNFLARLIWPAVKLRREAEAGGIVHVTNISSTGQCYKFLTSEQ